MPPGVHVTTPIIWSCAGILLVLDVLLVVLARDRVSRKQFAGIRYRLAVSGGVFYLLVWTSVMLWAWDWFYAYIFPSLARYSLPAIFCLGYTLIAWGMVWLSLRLPGNPVVSWGILGGVEGLLSHLYAIYGLGAASKPPIMQGVDPLAVLVFAVFEKAFYWSLILLGCHVLTSRQSRRLA